MLILGRKYKFTKLEKKRLYKKNYKLNLVSYSNRDSNDVLKEIRPLISKKNINVIVLNTKAKVDDEIIKYLTSLQFEEKIRIITIERFLEDYLHKCYIPEDHTDLHYLEDIKPFNTWQYFQKRTIDYLSVFTLFLLMLPFIFLIKNKQKKQSPGALYFSQNRVGKNKNIFKCMKFRTMHEDSYHDPYTQESDDRIYKYGDFLRKARVDELPQIINILKGEMHLIGPRAEWDILVKEYEKEIPYYHERHIVRPGITGWAQVHYPYGTNSEDTKQKLMYDLYYIKHWNIFLEIKVAWKTVMVVLGKKGM